MQSIARLFIYGFVLLALVVPVTSCVAQTDSKPAPTPPLPTADVVSGITEKVIIDGQEYPVPSPWHGNRLYAPEYTFESFKKIPSEFTVNNSKVYVLAESQPHLVALLERAKEDGIDLRVESGYRSVSYQKRIFKRMFEKGRTFEDIVRYVAPPGYSQHMFGTAVDFYPSNWRFAETPQYIWLQENAHAFGFEETYSQYNALKMPWEAWHWNYAGK
jgi:D-alanyl-D-alanine carboxypeptidase